MKKKSFIYLLLGIVFLSGCSNDDDSHSQNIDKEVYSIVQVLNGKFIGSLYSSTTNTTETEEVTFSPYPSVKEEVSMFDGKIKVYGTAVVTEYVNDHLLEITNNCYYSVEIPYTGAEPTLSFYPYSENGEINDKADKRIITVLSDISFKMRDYGLTENNDKTYIKQ